MKWTSIVTHAFMLLVASTFDVTAQVQVQPITRDESPFYVEQSFIADQRIWLIATELRPGTANERALYSLVDSGVMKHFDLENDLTQILPVRNGFVARRRFPLDNRPLKTLQVELLDIDGQVSQTLLSEAVPSHLELVLATSLSGDTVYVIHTHALQSMVRALSLDGRVVWSRTVDFAVQSATATATGVVIGASPSGKGPPHFESLSLSGELQWQAELPTGTTHHKDISFVAGDRIFIRYASPTVEHQLLVLNSETGAVLARTSTPPVDWITPTRDGALLSGRLFLTPYVAKLDREGRMAWWRRFSIDTRASQLMSAAYLQGDELLAITQLSRVDLAQNRMISQAVLVRSEPTGTALMNAYGQCVQADAWQLEKLQTDLWRNHSIGIRADPFVPPHAQSAKDCAEIGDLELLRYLQALTQMLGAKPAGAELWRFSFGIVLTKDQTTSQLSAYRMNPLTSHAMPLAVSFRSNVNTPQQAVRFIQQRLTPHTRRMLELSDEFTRLTHLRATIDLSDAKLLSDSKLMERLERTLARLNQLIGAMPESERVVGRANPYIETRIEPDRFGDETYMRPTDEAPETLKALFERRRQRGHNP